MSLDKKYQIPEETIKRMVKDGVISCSIVRGYEVYDRYLEIKGLFPELSNSKIFIQMADEFKMSDKNIDRIVYSLKNGR